MESEMPQMVKEIGNVLYGGIRPDIPGHGGEECARYLSPRQMLGETLLSTAMMVVVGILAWRSFTLPRVFPKHEDLPSKRLLLTFMCLMFGVEIGYKIYLLASKPGTISFSVLRMLIHYLYGAMIAMLFPETMARELPGELIVYWIEHISIFFIVPPYLVWLWGPKTLEPFKEWSWACFAGVLFGVQHHYIMQPIAIVTHVNLNYLLCPAVVDPFNGPYYRLVGIFHQTVCLLVIGKLYTLLLRLILYVLSPILPTRDYTIQTIKED